MRFYRKLFPLEADRLAAHLKRLTPIDRHRRFFAGMGDAGIDAHCRRIDWLHSIVIGFFEDGELRGVVEVLLDRAERCAEIAISVETPWQRQGIGTELLRRAIVVAKNRAVRHVAMLCLAENWRMQRLARRFTDRLSFQDGDILAELHLAIPTPVTLFEEAVEDGFGAVTLWLDQLRAPPSRKAA
jgi:GNAT superfamily N-acetyltransferase